MIKYDSKCQTHHNSTPQSVKNKSIGCVYCVKEKI